MYKTDNIEHLNWLLNKARNNNFAGAKRTKLYKKMTRRVSGTIAKQIRDFDLRAVKEIVETREKADTNQEILDKVNNVFREFHVYLSPKEVTDFLIVMGERGGREALRELDINYIFSLKDEAVLNNLRNRTSLLIENVDNTTREWIAKEISQGLDANMSADEIVASLAKQAPDIARWRGALIVHAEAVNAINEVQMEAYEKNGVVQIKWVTVGDSRVTRGCEINEAAGWWQLGRLFPGNTDPALGRVKKPPRHPRCRCTIKAKLDSLIPVTSEIEVDIWNGAQVVPGNAVGILKEEGVWEEADRVRTTGLASGSKASRWNLMLENITRKQSELTPGRFQQLIDALDQVVDVNDPVGQTVKSKIPFYRTDNAQ